MEFICHKKCTTCKKAQAYLESHNVSISIRDIQLNPPTLTELRIYKEKSKLEVKKMFNTSGMKYRELNLKDKLKSMSEEEMLKLLASDGMLVKRPVLVCDDTVLFGFKEDKYEAVLP